MTNPVIIRDGNAAIGIHGMDDEQRAVFGPILSVRGGMMGDPGTAGTVRGLADYEESTWPTVPAESHTAPALAAPTTASARSTASGSRRTADCRGPATNGSASFRASTATDRAAAGCGPERPTRRAPATAAPATKAGTWAPTVPSGCCSVGRSPKATNSTTSAKSGSVSTPTISTPSSLVSTCSASTPAPTSRSAVGGTHGRTTGRLECPASPVAARTPHDTALVSGAPRSYIGYQDAVANIARQTAAAVVSGMAS